MPASTPMEFQARTNRGVMGTTRSTSAYAALGETALFILIANSGKHAPNVPAMMRRIPRNSRKFSMRRSCSMCMATSDLDSVYEFSVVSVPFVMDSSFSTLEITSERIRRTSARKHNNANAPPTDNQGKRNCVSKKGPKQRSVGRTASNNCSLFNSYLMIDLSFLFMISPNDKHSQPNGIGRWTGAERVSWLGV